MKQVLQNLRTGSTSVTDVPCPTVREGQLLIRSSRTLVSAGTERMLREFGQSGWMTRARQQPDKVRRVLDKVKTDGLLPTIDAVRHKLDQPLAMGYSNVGVVLEVGAGVTDFSVGDRVASNGCHAEVVSVPAILCARIPANVSDDDAAITVIGAVALQSIRLAAPTLGEAVVVTGLGLIGLVTVQLLRAQGCRVLGIDLDSTRLALARGFGAEVVNPATGEDLLAAAHAFSRGRGVDAVIIAASTTSSEPIHQAAQMCRKRGRIVLVGVTGLELSRTDFFEKELTFQVSCSYGPGRHDANYEDKGVDYPIGQVRWTAQRNFEAVLDMITDRRLAATDLISHRFTVDETERAYTALSEERSLGILLTYPTLGRPDAVVRETTVRLDSSGAAPTRTTTHGVAVAFVGSGNYATRVLIPAFKKAGAALRTVSSNGGVTAVHAGRKFGFTQSTTDTNGVFADPLVNTVVIATRHDSHASLVCQALTAGKHVFVEKPLALTRSELETISEAHAGSRAAGVQTLVMVGFNRRFAPHIRKIKELLSTTGEPKTFLMTVNAGAMPPGHWTQDPLVGGGRIVGEACHFVDLLRFLAGSPIAGFHAVSLARPTGASVVEDKSTFTLRFADGSLGTIVYWANGHKSFPKERLEVFCGGRVLQLDNFRKLTAFGWPGFSRMRLWRQDKGQEACASAFVQAIEQRGPSPIPFDQLLEVGRVTIELAEALR